jgi:D-3-phosphoglycerate dehydrogenase
MSTSETTKRLFYFEKVPHARMLEEMAKQADLEVVKLGFDDPAADLEATIASSHFYQIRATRGELPAPYFANSELLKRCPELLVISSSGAGYDTINVDDCTAAGVLVVNQAGGNKEAVAEHALGMMLTLSKRITETDREMRRSENIAREAFMGHNIQEKTVGLLGLGNIGTRMAELCGQLFAMEVLTYDPYLSAEECKARGATRVSFDELLERSDYLSIHCPRTAETVNIMDAAAFAKMKRGAFFITTARGGIHDEAALADALRDKHIAGAGLDVWAQEPPSPNHALMAFDNVLVSPHTAGVSHESRENVGRIAAEQIATISAGTRPPRLLNPQAWEGFAERWEKRFGVRPQ